MTIALIGGLAQAIGVLWSLSLCFRQLQQLIGDGKFNNDRVTDLMSTIYFELRPFYPLGALADVATDVIAGESIGTMRILAEAWCLLIWWLTRHDNDDRWKRRRKNLADKVAEVGGRLVVMPAGAPS